MTHLTDEEQLVSELNNQRGDVGDDGLLQQREAAHDGCHQEGRDAVNLGAAVRQRPRVVSRSHHIRQILIFDQNSSNHSRHRRGTVLHLS